MLCFKCAIKLHLKRCLDEVSADCARWSPGGESAGCAAAGVHFFPLISPHVASSLHKVFEASHRVETSLKPGLHNWKHTMWESPLSVLQCMKLSIRLTWK